MKKIIKYKKQVVFIFLIVALIVLNVVEAQPGKKKSSSAAQKTREAENEKATIQAEIDDAKAKRKKQACADYAVQCTTDALKAGEQCLNLLQECGVGNMIKEMKEEIEKQKKEKKDDCDRAKTALKDAKNELKESCKEAGIHGDCVNVMKACQKAILSLGGEDETESSSEPTSKSKKEKEGPVTEEQAYDRIHADDDDFDVGDQFDKAKPSHEDALDEEELKELKQKCPALKKDPAYSKTGMRELANQYLDVSKRYETAEKNLKTTEDFINAQRTQLQQALLGLQNDQNQLEHKHRKEIEDGSHATKTAETEFLDQRITIIKNIEAAGALVQAAEQEYQNQLDLSEQTCRDQVMKKMEIITGKRKQDKSFNILSSSSVSNISNDLRTIKSLSAQYLAECRDSAGAYNDKINSESRKLKLTLTQIQKEKAIASRQLALNTKKLNDNQTHLANAQDNEIRKLIQDQGILNQKVQQANFEIQKLDMKLQQEKMQLTQLLLEKSSLEMKLGDDAKELAASLKSSKKTEDVEEGAFDRAFGVYMDDYHGAEMTLREECQCGYKPARSGSGDKSKQTDFSKVQLDINACRKSMPKMQREKKDDKPQTT